MTATHAAVIAVSVTMLALTPTLIAWLVVRADDLADYADDVRGRLPGRAEDVAPRHPPIERTVRELRRIRAALGTPVGAGAELAELEQAESQAVDLERTNRVAERPDGTELASPSTERLRQTARFQAELRREALWITYDETLREACRALGVPQYLDSALGVDVELERLRVEAELHQAGLRF